MKKTCPRSLSLVAGFALMLCYGILYAWSIYSSPLADAFGWNSAQLGLCFTVIMICFCLGGILGSILKKRFECAGAILIGAVMSAAGYGLASRVAADTLWLLYVSFALSALGCGIVYNAAVSTVVMRFPDKKGLASGILLMGFGTSTLVFGSLASTLMGEDSLGWRTVYLATGVLLLVVGILARRFIVAEAPAPADGKALTEEKSFSAGEMLSTASFWLFFASVAVLILFGQGVIGHAKGIAQEAGIASELAALTVGLISVANGLGRIVFGAIQDKKGYRFALSLDAALLIAAGAVIFLFLKKDAPIAIVAALMLCGLCYGAGPTVSASVTREFFGPDNFAQNLSLTNMTVIVASFGSTFMGSMQTATGSYAGAAGVFAAMEILPILFLTVLKKLRSKKT